MLRISPKLALALAFSLTAALAAVAAAPRGADVRVSTASATR